MMAYVGFSYYLLISTTNRIGVQPVLIRGYKSLIYNRKRGRAGIKFRGFPMWTLPQSE